MKLLIAALVALAFPATAWGEATIVTRELPVNGERTLAATQAPQRFNLLGLHWRGPGRVFFRVLGRSGWTGWHEADAEPEDLPDRGTNEARRMRGWRIGNPWWTNTADRVQVRTHGRVQHVRASFVWSPEEPTLDRSLQMAGAPPIITRTAWHANERIRRDNPSYARTLNDVIVHHTAGAGPSTPAQSAAIVRGIMTYHVLGNGWDDIGYNFLVDRFGQVFEGRYGGIERNVIGAHAQGFNTGSSGIAIIGTYSGAGPSAAARTALTRLIAWRLDVAHVYPLSRVSAISSGNPKFASGRSVWLRAVSGHRDTGFTSCPGAGLYGQIGAVAQQAAVTGLPKLYTPEVEGSVGGLVSFSAKLSSSLPWTVTVFDSARQQVAFGTGTGSTVRWTWDSRLAGPGPYTYRISAPNLRPATGTLSSPTGGLALAALHAAPSGFTPNGDGVTDTTRISYRLGAPANVTIDLQTMQAEPIATLYVAPEPAGSRSFVWDAFDYPDGRYRIVVTARGAGGRQLSAATNVIVARTLSGYSVTPTVLSPNGDGKNDTADVSFTLATPALVRLQVLKDAKQIVRPLFGPLPAGPQALSWAAGVRDGDYDVALTVTDATGPVTQIVPVKIDRIRPKLVRVSQRPLRVSLSEPARVTVVADGLPTTFRRPKAGIFRVVAPSSKRVVIYAADDAGNVSSKLRLR
jgi:hypothetical protein